MISSYQSGLSAGSSAHQECFACQDIMRLARETLENRKRLGIAHCIPESDFLRGFVDGYEQHMVKTDGLCLFERIASNG